jgi:hypothetical protein
VDLYVDTTDTTQRNFKESRQISGIVLLFTVRWQWNVFHVISAVVCGWNGSQERNCCEHRWSWVRTPKKKTNVGLFLRSFHVLGLAILWRWVKALEELCSKHVVVCYLWREGSPFSLLTSCWVGSFCLCVRSPRRSKAGVYWIAAECCCWMNFRMVEVSILLNEFFYGVSLYSVYCWCPTSMEFLRLSRVKWGKQLRQRSSKFELDKFFCKLEGK